MSEQHCIRVMIVDDHAVVRSGLRFFLLAFDDIELIAEADSGEEALQLCEKDRPDVILMDMMMPGMDGATATQAIRERYPQVQVIALTSFREEDLVQRALQAGAISYLLKDTSDEKLGEAIRSAYAGHSTLAPEATEALIHATTHPHKLGDDLTEREREVLGLMVEGLNNVDIAERLAISRATAKFHVSNILSKLNVTNRAEAIVLAVQHKLVT